MNTFIKRLSKFALVGTSALVLAACSGGAEEAANDDLDLNNMSVEEIEEQAQAEGEIHSVGMPDSWANWEETWNDLNEQYGLEHTDTDMSSAEELATFENEKDNASADIGDVGIAFGPEAIERGLLLPYKTSYYDEIPDWAKDEEGEGYWMLSYTGTMAFVVDTESTNGNVPTSWQEVLDGDYAFTIGDVSSGNQDQFALHSAAVAFGGDETDLQPGLDFFGTLASEGRLNVQGHDTATMEAGEHQVVGMWDFNALAMQEELGDDRFEVVIPQDGASMSGYTTILNRYSQNPHAAALAREYILSDEGQNNLARGYARPIREVELDEDAAEALLPESEYENANVAPIEDSEAWDEVLPQLGNMWQENVISQMN
jgi:putative spermidine/putrescine transport system substrate-binding protein